LNAKRGWDLRNGGGLEASREDLRHWVHYEESWYGTVQRGR